MTDGSRSNDVGARSLRHGLAWDRLPGSARFDVVFLTALVGFALLFYAAPWAPVYAGALACVSVLSILRPDLGILLVPLFAPGFGTPKALGSRIFPPSEIFLVVSVVAVLIYLIRNYRQPGLAWEQLRRTPFLWPALLLLLAGTISTVAATDHAEAFRAYRLVLAEPILFFALVLLLGKGRGFWLLLMGAVVVAGVGMSVLGLWQYATQQDLSLVPHSGVQRIKGLYGSPDNLGLLLDRALPLACAALLGVTLQVRARLAWATGTVIMLVALFLTFSRGAWLGIGLAVLLVLFLLYRWGRWVVLVAVLVALLGAALQAPRLMHVFGAGHSGTVRVRLDLWQSSLRMARDHPVLGVGPDNFLHYFAPPHQAYLKDCKPGLGYMNPRDSDQPCLSHPHNIFLDFWLSTGVAGLLAMVLLQVVFWRHAIDQWRRTARVERAMVLGAMAAMLAGLVHGLVDNSYFLEDLAIFTWVLLGSVSFLVTRPPQSTSTRETGGRP